MNKKILVSLYLLLLILVAVPLTVFLVKQSAELRKEAGPAYQKTATLSLFSDDAQIQANDIFTITILFDPQNQPVASLQMAMNYSPNLEFQGTQVTPSITELNYSPNQVLPGQRLIQVAATLKDPQSPYKPADEVTFGTMKFKALSAGSATIDFQPNVTAVYGPGSTENLLSSADGFEAEITAGTGGPTPTPTPTARPTAIPNLTPTPTPTSPGMGGASTPTPTPRLSPSPAPTPTPRLTPTPTAITGTVATLSGQLPNTGEPLLTLLLALTGLVLLSVGLIRLSLLR